MKTRMTAAVVAAAMAVPASAQNGDAVKFGARESVQQISISPGGTHVAMIMPVAGRASAVFVADVVAGGLPKAVLQASGEPEKLTDCQWATDMRLVCAMITTVRDGALIGYTRLYSLNRDGSDLKMLTARTGDRSLSVAQNGGRVIDWTGDGEPGSVLATRTFVAERTTGSLVARGGEGLGVERVDTKTLKRTTIVPPKPNAAEYISDGRGVIRIMGTWSRMSDTSTGDTISYFYSKGADRDWQPLSKVVSSPTGSAGFDPYAVDPGSNVAYGFDATDGRSALYRVALDGTLRRDLVVSRPDVDIDSLLRIGRQKRVVGVSFVTDRRETEFFDPELRKLGQSLLKALPGKPLVTFVDASADETKLLLFAGSDNDAGIYYIFNKATRKLSPVLPARQQLVGTTLATVRPIRFPAADGTMIPGYLTLPPGSNGRGLPAIVMPHGGPAARDEWGFDWLAQYFASRGFAVLQPNFRGSSGYGSAWFQKNGFQSWRTAIGDVNDAGRWLVKEGIGDPRKLAIVGWSYGGYAALQSAVIEPDLYKAVVAIAPVTDLDQLREQYRRFTNFAQVSAFIGTGPHVASGSPARHTGKITAPVLLFHGDMDQNVGVGESRTMASRLRGAGKMVEFVEFKGLDHQLDDGKARGTMLDKADAFLRTAMGM